jgi:hypothetical protein
MRWMLVTGELIVLFMLTLRTVDTLNPRDMSTENSCIMSLVVQ